MTVQIRPAKAGGGTAVFGTACTGCPLAAQCTSSADGRTVAITRYEAELARARAAQTDPAWVADYKATRPKVERKIGHLMRRRHGGRRARVRGRPKVAADFSLLAAATNLARFGALGLRSGTGQTWATAAIRGPESPRHKAVGRPVDQRPTSARPENSALTEPAHNSRSQPPQQPIQPQPWDSRARSTPTT